MTKSPAINTRHKRHTPPTPKHRPIHTIEGFMHKLNKACPKKDGSLITHAHRIIQQHQSKLGNVPALLQTQLKFCKKCKKMNKIKGFMQCGRCQDHYHSSCVKETQRQGEIWVCGRCLEEGQYRHICRICGGNAEKKTIKCAECRLVFHVGCLKGQRICQWCQAQSVQLNGTMLEPQKDFNIKTSGYLQYQNKQRFSSLQWSPSKEELSYYKNMLTLAIQDKKMFYCEELSGMEQYYHMNIEDSMDFGIECINKEEKDAFAQYKRQPIGPWKMEKTEEKGWDVVADRDIPKDTLICEYVGDVFTHRELLWQPQNLRKNDSVMELRTGKTAEQTLFIVPHCHTNIARFINGVKHPKHANLSSMTVLVEGRPAVLLAAKRHIRRGESLLYDYNAGKAKAYDTSDFAD